MLIFTLAGAFAFTEEYPLLYGTTNDGKDIFLGTGDATFYSDVTNGNGSTVDGIRTGDTNGDGIANIISQDGNTLYIFNRTLGDMKTINLESTARGFNLYDVDSDGMYEIIYIGDAGSFGFVRVYDYSGGNYILKHSGYNLSNDITEDHNPVCVGSTCYFVDTTGVVYKYNSISNTFTDTLSTGNGIRRKNIIIDDCTPAWTGDDLMFLVDSDSDGAYGGYTIVDLSTFNNYVTLELHDKVSGAYDGRLNSEFLCEEIGGNHYILWSGSNTYGGGSSCYANNWQSTYYLGIDQIFSNNSVSIIQDKSVSATHGQSASTGFCPHSWGAGQPFLYDVSGDGVDDVCGIGAFSEGCGSGTAGCHDKFNVYCYNISDGTVFENTKVSLPQNGQLGSGGSYRTFVVDYQGDTDVDFYIGNRYYEYSSNTWNTVSGISDYAFRYQAPIKYGTDCISYYWIYGGDTEGRISEAVSCDYTPIVTSGTIVFLNETFTTGAFTLPESSCSEDSYTSASMKGATPVSLDNDWYCYVENKTASSVIYQDETSTSKIHTSRGLETQHLSTAYPQYDSIAVFPSQIDLTSDDIIEFYCSVDSTGKDSWNYLVLSEEYFSGYPIAISLQDGGCVYNSTVIGGNLDACLELYDITGDDCDHTTTTHFNFTLQDAVDTCEIGQCGELNFQDIERVEIWRNKFSDNDTFYFDDLQIYREGVVANNSLPYIIFVSPIPDPQNVSQIVSWSVSIGDAEDPSGAIWSKFDCGDDGTLDYNWAKRGNAPSFDCAYDTEGNYTGTAWASDDAHYPTFYDTDTAVVEILELEEEPAPPQGGSCIGFSAPPCTGDCYFFDDFGYNNPLECNEWEGTAKDVNPQSSILSIYNLPVYKYDIEIDGDTYSEGTIYETMYEDYEIEFKIRLSHHSTVQFDVLDEELDQYSVFLIFSNYNAIVYDPSQTTIKAMTPDQWYVYKMQVDLVSDTILWYVDDELVHSGYFYDGATDSQRRFSIGWSSILADFDIDYFSISYGTLQANATLPEEEVAYEFTTDLFCAINWTTNVTEDRFKEEYCTMRGYNTAYPLLSLCVPRACISDIAQYTFQTATSNIFITIVIVTAFILIAPLLIRKR